MPNCEYLVLDIDFHRQKNVLPVIEKLINSDITVANRAIYPPNSYENLSVCSDFLR